MPTKKQPEDPPVAPRQFASLDEIDRGIKKLERRIEELEGLDARRAIMEHSGEDVVVQSNIREAIRDVFGPCSPEFKEHAFLDIWAGPMMMGMLSHDRIRGTEAGKIHVRTILQGLIARLKEKREELADGTAPLPQTYFSKLNLHPRIGGVANELYGDGHHWPAVFEGSKALVNYVKECSARHDLDGVQLMHTVFSRKNPVLAFNDLADQTKQDEQEGMMHLFVGAVLAIRNPGGHTFPEGSEQRALEYISFLSLLAYRVDETKRVKPQ